MPSLKPVNFNYFLSVKNMLEEDLLEHDHITSNTTIYCVTKQRVDNRKFIREPTTIVLHIKTIVQAVKKHSANHK